MFRADGEPRLCDLLEDPILRLVMERDGVTMTQLRRVIGEARQRMGWAPPALKSVK